MTPRAATTDPSARVLHGVLMLCALAVAVYLPTLRHGFVWDDDANITANVTVQAPAGIARIWLDPFANQQYYPLTHTSFWLEHRLWGLWAPGYHAVNMGLHALAAVLLWRLLAVLGVPGALLAAALFAVHPVEVESVAWITERKNLLSGVLCLASAGAFVRWAALGGIVDRRPRRYALALALFAAAMLAKTAVVVLPPVLLLLCWWKRGRLRVDDVVPLLPYVAIGGFMGLTTAWLEKSHLGAEGEFWTLSLAEHVLLAGRALSSYAATLLWPANLNFIYPRFDLDPASPAQWLHPVGWALLLAATFAAQRRIGRGPFTAIAAFVIALVPALGIFNLYFMLYSYVQDHFQFLASMPFLALVAAVLHAGWCRVGAAWPRWSAGAAAGLLLATLTLVSWQRVAAFADEATLWRSTLEKNPAAWMARINLGQILAEKGQTADATAQFEAALRTADAESRGDRPDPRLDLARAQAHNNLATILLHGGRPAEAAAHLEQAVALRPSYAEAFYNLGLVREAQRQGADAAAAYRAAIRLNPRLAAPHNNLAIVLYEAGDCTGAWREVAALRGLGTAPHPDFVKALAARCPDQLARPDRALDSTED